GGSLERARPAHRPRTPPLDALPGERARRGPGLPGARPAAHGGGAPDPPRPRRRRGPARAALADDPRRGARIPPARIVAHTDPRVDGGPLRLDLRARAGPE